jgi:hypothetical protein
MAKSNLRQKDKTFNFGLAAGFSESEEEEKVDVPDFYHNAGNGNQELASDNDEEEI